MLKNRVSQILNKLNRHYCDYCDEELKFPQVHFVNIDAKVGFSCYSLLTCIKCWHMIDEKIYNVLKDAKNPTTLDRRTDTYDFFERNYDK